MTVSQSRSSFLSYYPFFIQALGSCLGGGKVDCFTFSLTACGLEERDDNSLSREKVEPWVCLALQK